VVEGGSLELMPSVPTREFLLWYPNDRVTQRTFRRIQKLHADVGMV